MYTNEQFTAQATQFNAQVKAGFESAFAQFSQIAHSQFAGAERLIELNVATAKAALEASVGNTQKAFAAKDPQELIAISTAFAQPAFEKVAAYSKSVYEITTEANGELVKTVEANTAEAQKQFATLLDKTTKSVPGSEGAVAAVKTAMSAANSAYDNAAKAFKQGIEMAEANIKTATAQASNVAAAAVKAKAKK